MMPIVGMLGEGAWGTAIANLLAENGCVVYLWCYNPNIVTEIQDHRTNHCYARGTLIHKRIIPTSSLKTIFEKSEFVFEAIPVKYLRSVVAQAKLYATPKQTWIILSKGIECETALMPNQIVDDALGFSVAKAALLGPSFAQDLSAHDFTAFDLAVKDRRLGDTIAHLIRNEYVAVHLTTDLIGVQLCSALKNVIALGVGMLSGAGYGDNSRSALITLALHEVAVLVEALGGQRTSVYGLAGVGDLILTATGKSSRNLEVGQQLGRGKTLENILKETGYIPEAINTINALPFLFLSTQLKISLLVTISAVALGKASIETLIEHMKKKYSCLL